MAGDGARGSDREFLATLAGRFLPPDVRDRWLALLKPAVRLRPAEAADSWVARFGGLPTLAEDRAWPSAEHGPLSYIGEIAFARLAEFDLPLGLPQTGRLLFFYFDGTFRGGTGSNSLAASYTTEVIVVPDGVSSEPRATPEGLVAYEEVNFEGHSALTFPNADHPDFRAEFWRPGEDLFSHLVCSDEFVFALDELSYGPVHQVGGYASPVQGPVEDEVAHAALADELGDHDDMPDGDAEEAEATRWELLLQVDYDDSIGMQWGDDGALYWLARPDDLAGGDLSKIRVTWQTM